MTIDRASHSDSTSENPARSEHHDATLVAGLLSRDGNSWTTFFDTYGRLIRSSIVRVVRRFGVGSASEEVRDIEAALAVELLTNDMAKLRAYQPERGVKLSTWVSMLASHAAYDFLRRRRREPVGAPIDDAMLPSGAPDPYTLCELGERARLVGSIVERFSGKDRTFLELYYADGLEPNEVADRMGISVKTVYSKKHKIQGRLESMLAEARFAA